MINNILYVVRIIINIMFVLDSIEKMASCMIDHGTHGGEINPIIFKSTDTYESNQSSTKYPNDLALYLNKIIDHCLKNTS